MSWKLICSEEITLYAANLHRMRSPFTFCFLISVAGATPVVKSKTFKKTSEVTVHQNPHIFKG